MKGTAFPDHHTGSSGDVSAGDGIVKTLIDKQLTITVMESCTGGLMASTLTDTEGASAIFKGSLVTYANETKVAAGVDAAVIQRHGVYSAETARAMAAVAQQKFGTDLAIGITGSTGNPDPNNRDSVVGEMFCCIRLGDTAHDFRYTTDVAGKSRAEIKVEYVDFVREQLAKVVAEGLSSQDAQD